jgi:hypothetical protein
VAPCADPQKIIGKPKPIDICFIIYPFLLDNCILLGTSENLTKG